MRPASDFPETSLRDDHLGLALITQDAEGSVVDCSEAAARLLRTPREALIGSTLTDLPWIIPVGLPDNIIGLAHNPPTWLQAHVERRYNRTTTSLTDVTDLVASESRHRSMFTDHASPMLLIDASTGGIVDANPAAAQFYGYTLETLRRMHSKDLGILEIHRHAGEHVCQHRLGNGTVRSVEMRTSVIDRNCLFSIIREVKPHTAKDSHLHLLADQMSDVVLRADRDGVIEWVSPSITAATGWEPEDLLRLNCTALVHPDDLAIAWEAHAVVLRTQSTQVRLRMRDGTYRWFDIRLDPLQDESRTPVGLVARWRDIDQEHRAQLELTALRERLSLILDSVNLGTWDWNVETGEMVVNQTWAAIAGYHLAELHPVSIRTWLDLLHPDDLPLSNALLDAHAEGFSDFYEAEVRLRHRDGWWVWVLDRGRVVERAPDGAALRMTGTLEDITERKEAEQRLARSEARYRSLVERMADVVVALDANGIITFASPSLAALLGFEPREWVGQPCAALMVDGCALDEMLQRDRSSARFRVRRADGDFCWVEAVSQVQHAADGSPTGVIGAWRDVTEAVEVEAMLREESSTLSAIADHLGDVVIHMEDEKIRWVSASIASAFGGPAQLWLGKELAEHVHPDDRAVVANARRRLESGRRDRSRLRLRDLNGAYHWVDVIGVPLSEGPKQAVLSIRLVDDDVAREGTLRRMAGSDSLTGLPNRRELMNTLAWQLFDRSEGTTAVLFCDVDNLKEINDTYGHAVGDALLLVVANRMLAQIRPGDMCARFGGDEFVVLLRGITSEQAALSVAERIRAAIATPISAGGLIVDSSVSIGVAVAGSGETPGPIVHRADAAMYEAKRAGRNRTVSG